MIDRLNGIPGGPLSGRPADSVAQARTMVLEREVDAALLVAPDGRADRLLVASAGGPSGVQALERVLREADPSQPVRITDLRPPNEADGRGLAPSTWRSAWSSAATWPRPRRPPRTGRG